MKLNGTELRTGDMLFSPMRNWLVRMTAWFTGERVYRVGIYCEQLRKVVEIVPFFGMRISPLSKWKGALVARHSLLPEFERLRIADDHISLQERLMMDYPGPIFTVHAGSTFANDMYSLAGLPLLRAGGRDSVFGRAGTIPICKCQDIVVCEDLRLLGMLGLEAECMDEAMDSLAARR